MRSIGVVENYFISIYWRAREDPNPRPDDANALALSTQSLRPARLMSARQ